VRGCRFPTWSAKSIKRQLNRLPSRISTIVPPVSNGFLMASASRSSCLKTCRYQDQDRLSSVSRHAAKKSETRRLWHQQEEKPT